VTSGSARRGLGLFGGSNAGDLAARVESRLRNDKALRKVVDEIVYAVENSKNQA